MLGRPWQFGGGHVRLVRKNPSRGRAPRREDGEPRNRFLRCPLQESGGRRIHRADQQPRVDSGMRRCRRRRHDHQDADRHRGDGRSHRELKVCHPQRQGRHHPRQDPARFPLLFALRILHHAGRGMGAPSQGAQPLRQGQRRRSDRLRRGQDGAELEGHLPHHRGLRAFHGGAQLRLSASGDDAGRARRLDDRAGPRHRLRGGARSQAGLRYPHRRQADPRPVAAARRGASGARGGRCRRHRDQPLYRVRRRHRDRRGAPGGTRRDRWPVDQAACRCAGCTASTPSSACPSPARTASTIIATWSSSS